MIDTALALTEEYKQFYRSRLEHHTVYVHNHVMPWHQQVWAQALQDFSINRLVLIAPPKYGKSPTVLDYLGWRIGKDPENYHCIYVSNTSRQANKYSVALRDTIAYSKQYRELYGLLPDVNKGWAENEWFIKRANQSDKDPTLQATGVGGPIIGATAQEVIYDDIADQENMATKYQREKLMDWVRKTPQTRLVPGGRAVMICTRWHEEDPAAEFEKEGWVVIQIPAIREDGTLTYPEYWTAEALAESRENLSDRDFEMIFQGHVLPAGGNIFKREWWRYWNQGLAPWQYEIEHQMYLPIQSVVQSWDTAFKDKQKNDFSVCETWGVVKNGYYLLDLWRGKAEFPALKQVAVQLADKHKPIAVLIEDAASGQSLIQELKASTRIPVIAVKVDSDKISRANAVTPMLEAGKAFLPEQVSWRPAFEYEHEIFPGGAHDDQVDATTQFLNWIRRHAVEGPRQAAGVPKQSIWREGHGKGEG